MVGAVHSASLSHRGKFYLGLGCSKIRQKRSSVSLLLKPIVGWNTMISRRRFYRLIVMYKQFNGHIDWNFNFSFFKNIRRYAL